MSAEYEKALAEFKEWVEVLKGDGLDSRDNLSGEMRDVVERDLKFIDEGGAHDDPRAPVRQWNARQRADELRADYEAGREVALLEVVRECADHGLTIPEWAAAEFARRLDNARLFRVRTLDEAFGRFLPDGKSFTAAKKRTQKSLAIYRDAAELKKRGFGTGEALFAELGRRHGVSASTARDYFYSARDWHPAACAALDVLDDLLAASKKLSQKM